jgi:hypothetical protein
VLRSATFGKNDFARMARHLVSAGARSEGRGGGLKGRMLVSAVTDSFGMLHIYSLCPLEPISSAPKALDCTISYVGVGAHMT